MEIERKWRNENKFDANIDEKKQITVALSDKRLFLFKDFISLKSSSSSSPEKKPQVAFTGTSHKLADPKPSVFLFI